MSSRGGRSRRMGYDARWAHLDEANVRGVLTEALAADHQAILPDDGVRVIAHTAATSEKDSFPGCACEI